MASLAAKILGVDSTSQLGRLSVLMWQARTAKEASVQRITSGDIRVTAYWIAELPLDDETVQYLPSLVADVVKDRSFEKELQGEMRSNLVLSDVLLDGKSLVRRIPDAVIGVLDVAIDDQLIPQQRDALKNLILWFGNYADGFAREKLTKLLDRLSVLSV